MKTCTKCGAQNKDDNVFCTACGQRLETVVVPNRTQYSNNTSEYKITFKRPNDVQMIVNVFHITIDNFTKYELKNNSEIIIPMSPGEHSIELSVFAMPKKKQFHLQVTEDMIFICKPNPLAIITYFVPPVNVYDVYGREY